MFAAISALAVLATPVQAGGRRHCHHGWNGGHGYYRGWNGGHGYYRGWNGGYGNCGYGYYQPYCRPVYYYPAPYDRPAYYSAAPAFFFGFGFR